MIKMNIRILNIILLACCTLMFVTSCEDDDFIGYDEINETRNDPFMDILVNTPVISFVAGEPAYTIDFLVITPNSDAAAKINVYKSFTDSKTGETTNTALLGAYDVTNGANATNIKADITFADLREGLTLNGNPLPTDELAIAIGSTWKLTFEPVTSGGEAAFSTGKTITVGVLSPFAGIYEVIESAYFRIGVDQGGWNGEQIFIGSVDDNTFSHNDWWGPFEAAGAFVFDLNDDNTLTILDDPSQLFFSGDDMLTCQDDSGKFGNVPCATSNILEPAEDGRHIIKLTYGYFTASGDENEGAREFYEVLRKIN